jgi:hypothetical protein
MRDINLLRTPIRRRPRPAFRPSLDTLEDRVVLSSASLSSVVAPVEVHALAVKNSPALNVSIHLTAITVNTIRRDPSGVESYSGTATGTILGQTFSTPVSGGLTAGKGGTSSLTLNLQPIALNLVGLGIQTGTIGLTLKAAKGGGALGRQVATEIKAAQTSGSVADASSVLGGSQVLNAINKALNQATQNLKSFTPVSTTSGAAVDLTVSRLHLNSGGLAVGSTGTITVDLLGNSSGGLLGNLVAGIPAGTTGKALTKQVSGVLQQITATPVPTVSQLGGGTTLGTTGTGTTGTGTTSTGTTATATGSTLIAINLNPLDINLLGLEIKTSQITVTVSALPGSGKLLGNLLTTVSNLINLQGVNTALNNVLTNVVTLANSASLSVAGVGTGGVLGSPVSTTPVPVLTAHVAPVHLDLLGAVVDTSPIDLSITANPGNGQVLGNVVAALGHLLDTAPKNGKIDVPFLTTQVHTLNTELAALAPNIPAAPSPVHTVPAGSRNVLSLVVAPINLNLLGLVLQTDQIQVNADAASGSGDLLGNLLSDLLNTLDATPDNMAAFNGEVNNLLAKVVGILNNTTLSLPANVLGTLSQTLQTLALPNLVNTTGAPASTPVLNLDIASAAGSTAPPIDVDLLGLVVTTSDVHARLVAQTGNGQILGNLVYNVSHLLDPGGAVGLVTLLQSLGL